jgi:P-type Cu2+ transporter
MSLDTLSGPRCAHCGEPCPEGRSHVAAGRPGPFCCRGCETVYGLIHQSGLVEYYDIAARLGDGAIKRAEGAKGDRNYAEFDDLAFADLYVRPIDGGLSRVELYLEGVHCASCVWLVERIGLVVPGVREAILDVGRSVVSVTWHQDESKLSAIARALEGVGYPPHPFRERALADLRRREDRSLLLRLTVSGAIAANVMLLAIALYAGWLNDMGPEWSGYFRWMSFAITTPAFFWCGAPFLEGAWASLKMRRLQMDVPLAIALGAGYFMGAYNTIRGRGEVYFDSVASVIFLLLIGRWILRRAQTRAVETAERLTGRLPHNARLVEDAGTRLVPAETVPAGATIRVLPGESVAADGVLLSRRGDVDTAWLTGETRALALSIGDEVLAGSIAVGASVDIRVTAAGEATRMAKLLRTVREASLRKPETVLFAQKASAGFVAIVLALAAATYARWVGTDPEFALENTMAMLVVTCPCVFGLATPLAFTLALGKAARRGMIVKGADALERLAGRATFFFDKTGTLTEGRPVVTGYAGDAALRAPVATLERRSAHPLAKALSSLAQEDPSSVVAGEAYRAGEGLVGTVNGVRVACGTWAFVESQCPEAVTRLVALGAARRAEATQVVFAAAETGEAAAITLDDRLRADAKGAVAAFRARGFDVGVLSGDREPVVARVAAALGIDAAKAHGDLKPTDKLAAIEQAAAAAKLAPRGHRSLVVMVGDGINDAAALAASHVGISVGGAAEAGVVASDIHVTREGLAPLVELVDFARLTMRTVHFNLAISATYNVMAAVAAYTGHIHPMMAAVLMPLSSLSVIGWTVFSLREKALEQPRPAPVAAPALAHAV